MNYDNDIIIENEENILINQQDVYDAMKNFQDKTGITPILIVTNESHNESAYDKYDELINDDNHWLIIYSTSSSITMVPDGYGNAKTYTYRLEEIHGKNTDSILDSYAIDQFKSDVYESKNSVHDRLVNAFNKTDNYIMDWGPTNTDFIIPIIFAGIIFIGIIEGQLKIKMLRDKLHKVELEIEINKDC